MNLHQETVFAAGMALAMLLSATAPVVAAPAAPDTPSAPRAATASWPVAVRRNMHMPWNAVVVDARGRYIVGSPRWTANGDTRPAVAIAEEDGTLVPYPDARWNAWEPGREAADALVSVNAIHRDARGDLWIVDSGAPDFGGAPVARGPKVVHVDPRTDTVVRNYVIPAAAIRAHSYVDDIRIRGRRAYLTDAGEGALLVLDLERGQVRRRFDGQPFVRARATDTIAVDGKLLRGADGRPLTVHADPLELSPDGTLLYFGPLSGPLSQIETRLLDDDSLDDDALARHVRPWFDIPPVGGTAMAGDGTLYYTPLADNMLMRRDRDGTTALVVRDARLRWADAPFLDGRGHIYLPVAQIDGAAPFNAGTSTMQPPFEVLRIELPAAAAGAASP